MTHDQLLITLIAAAWAGGATLIGLSLVWLLLRRGSVRWLIASVAVVSVLAVIAATLGTAQAMFLSDHDFGVIVLAACVAGAIASLAAVGVGVGVARSSESLRAAAERFGESGQFVATSAGPAELQELSAELARTSARLQESRRREDRLEESRRELVAWVSHDLRTPLAGMRAMAEALEDGLADDPARYHRQIRTEVDRMAQMVDDLFELSRIHAGNLKLSMEKLMLGDVISEAIASAYPVAQARGVHLGGSVDSGLEVIGDPTEISRVVSNLLMNAIRHTPADGVVEITARNASQGVELAVTDACGGLSEQDMSRAFDVAWQGSPARTPEAAAQFGSGAGLGLAIVRGIVEAHRGTVTVANHAPGCRFTVQLPA